MSIERICKCGRDEGIRFNFGDDREAEREFHSREFICPDCLENNNNNNNITNNKEMKKNVLNRGMNKGFLTGLLAFVIAKISHLVITGGIGFTIGFICELTGDELPWGLINFIDSPLVGLTFLVAATSYIYKELKK